MNKCPICNKKMSGKRTKPTLLRFVKHCPHCGALVRKKRTVWFPILLVLMAIPLGNIKTHWAYAVIGGLLAVASIVLFVCLPYEPYNLEENNR